jgi:hypothetical protein
MRRLLSTGFALLCVCDAAFASVKLHQPQEGAALLTNTPQFAWSSEVQGATRLVVDGVVLESWDRNIGSAVPFSLSYGPHSWWVEVDGAEGTVKSEAGTFVVDGDPLQSLPENALLLREGWQLQSSVLETREGSAISTEDGFKGYATSLPATCLTVLVRSGVYPNPNNDLNNMRIPDANDEFNAQYALLPFSHLEGRNPWADPYWYFRSFDLPADWSGKRLELVFTEINYRADVWVNGTLVGDREAVVGMERVFRFDVTKLLKADASNQVAVKIYPLDKPGLPDVEPITPLGFPGENMGKDGLISHNYTKWDSVGWDWQPAIRDRNVGITGDVYLEALEALAIRDYYVSAQPNETLDQAELQVELVVENPGLMKGDQPIRLSLESACGKKSEWAGSVLLSGEANQLVSLDSQSVPMLHMDAPELWWPIHYGKPYLYRMSVEVGGAETAAVQASTRFGVRKLDTRMQGESRVFTVNGKDIFIRAGNWVIDMMLNSTAERYASEMDFAAHANLNFLRVWGPTGVPPQAFFDAADERGIIIQQDFLHDHWGTFNNREGYFPPLDLFQQASTDIVKRLRNHASILLWCGGNEGINPRQDWIMAELLPTHDPRGGRYYLTASNGDGVQGGGPYHNLRPEEYFTSDKIKGFNSEVGPSGVPVWESVRRFMPVPPVKWVEGRFPLDAAWAFHDANNRGEYDTRKFTSYDDVLRSYYGSPEGEDEAAYQTYIGKAQMVNFETYRAAIEALNRKLWNGTTGYSLWKFNSSWPSMVWQLFDWYEQSHSGQYAARRANRPLHVQLNRDDASVTVMNLGSEDLSGVKVRASVMDAGLRKIWSHEASLVLPHNQATKADWKVPAATGIHFLTLELLDASGALLADNRYTLSDTDYRQLPVADPASLQFEGVVREDDGRMVLSGKLRVEGKAPMVLVRLKWVDDAGGTEFLPTFWSDNYLTLFPGETVDLEAWVPSHVIAGKSRVEVSAYNFANAQLVRAFEPSFE